MRRSLGRLAVMLALLTACTSNDAHAPASAAIKRTEQTSGTTALLISVSAVNDSVVWASGAQGTYVRTLDGGATWHAGHVPGADSLQFRDVHAVDADTAYLLSIGSGPSSRIYKTTDGGGHWALQFTNTDPHAFYDCMDFWDASHGIVVSDAVDGQVVIMTTTDGGAHWTRIPASDLPPAQAGEGSFAASGTCLVTAPGGHAWIAASNPHVSRVLHTADFGRTWTVDTLPLTTRDGSGVQSVSFHSASDGMAFGGGNSATPGDTIVATTHDGGRTWTSAGRPPFATGIWGGVFVPAAEAPVAVAVGPRGSAYSRDEGATWTVIDTLNYWGVGFASPGAGWAVGQKGRITKLAGF